MATFISASHLKVLANSLSPGNMGKAYPLIIPDTTGWIEPLRKFHEWMNFL